MAAVTGMSRFRFLYNLTRPYRWRLLLAVILTLVSTVFALTPPLVMRYLINEVVTPGHWQFLAVVVAVVAFIPVWNALLSITNRLLIAALGQRFIVDIRTTLYRHVLSLSMQYHGKLGAGLFMNRLMTD